MKTPLIEINRPNIKTVAFPVTGTSPLISHKWSEKAKKQMLDKQMKKASQGREAKNPEQDFKDSLYLLSNGEHPNGPYGFPAVGFKAAAVRAAKQVDGMTMTDARSWFFVIPDDGDLIKLKGDKPHIREDMVKIQQTTDIRFRGQFDNWSAVLNIKYNADQISDEQLLNLFELAGFSCGIGEWRMERGGTFGTFTLLNHTTELKKVA
jgi:hypothetical protein